MNPTYSKVKGRNTENEARDGLRDEFGYVGAERRRLTGTKDRGDITGIPGITIEVKSAAAWHPVKWQSELRQEMKNDGTDIGFVMARPRGGGDMSKWVFIVPVEVLRQLLNDAGWGP